MIPSAMNNFSNKCELISHTPVALYGTAAPEGHEMSSNKLAPRPSTQLSDSRARSTLIRPEGCGS